MDRRNGGDPLAPPRPPKTIPRVHTRQPQRTPEPAIMSARLQQSPNTIAEEATQPPRPPLQPRNLQQLQQPPPLPPVQSHHLHLQQHQHQHHPTQQQQQPSPTPLSVLTQAPITVPLTSSSFARRRPPPPGTAIPTISSQTPSPIVHSPESAAALSPVTLAVPRPETERLGNEYVDTPFRTPKLGLRHPAGLRSAHTNAAHSNSIVTSTVTNPAFATGTTTAHAHSATVPKSSVPHATTTTAATAATATPITKSMRSSLVPTSAITKQPLPFTKDQMTEALHEDIEIHPTNGDSLNSITCPQCKRCRCEECQRPRQLPSRWVCDNTCLCSAETIIDYTSCLCCVKALFYHCSKDHEMECDGDSISCADDPCSCLPHKRTQRWAWLSALSLALPCLWCYWPMRGCVAMCAKVYARHSRHGCRCPPSGNNNSGASAGRTIRSNDLTPEKRLLDSSLEF